ncbi:hypothetical protein FPV67DRAFT_740025 [Lyophyllum atratum]|nr:hypothetical protein FPV67DRAFT_740025 [Lyophyllum atratum]
MFFEFSSTMSVYPIFPQEIIDKIIKALDGPDLQTTLATCCTVSSSFCNAAQKMLYRSLSVSLGHREYAVQTKALESSLMSSSHLGTYVDSISFLIRPHPKIFFGALHKLNRLRSIKIQGTSFELWADWSVLPEIFKHNMYTIFGSPTLHEIHLSSLYNFPLSYLCATTCLKKLELRESVLSDDIAFDKPYSPPPSIDPKRTDSLQTLILRENSMSTLHPALLSAVSHLHASGLRRLEVGLRYNANVIGLNAVLRVATSSLEELYIDTDTSFPLDSPEMRLELGSLENLRHVAFKVESLAELRCIASLCESLRASHLHHLTLAVGGLLCGPANVGPGAVDEAKSEWRRIDEYSMGGHGTSPLRLIRVIPIRVPQRHRSTVPAYFEESMPRIYSAGRLRVERETEGKAQPKIF